MIFFGIGDNEDANGVYDFLQAENDETLSSYIYNGYTCSVNFW